jgi:hypothetical protein
MSMQMQLAIVSADEVATLAPDADFDDLTAIFERDGSVDLEWMWDAVQSLFDKVNPLFEGDPVTDDVGYGPARYVSVERTRAVASAIAKIKEKRLRARFDPKQLTARRAYPFIWDRADELAENGVAVVEGALAVIDLYRRAAASNQGVLIVLW